MRIMDKTTIKMVLSAYRVAGRDAADPIFAEALRAAESDLELKAWFEETQRFDALMVDTLGQVPTPAGLKETILLDAASGASFAPARAPFYAWRRQAAAGLAMAAGLLLAFLLGRLTLPGTVGHTAAADDRSAGANRLALQAIAYTGKMPALQFVCFDASAVAGWVEKKAAVLKMGKLIDRPLARLQMIGSSTAEWEGKPVMMIALQNGEQMAMLYIVRAADFPGAVGDAGEVMEKDGWVSKTGRHGEHLYVLTTKGTRQNLDFPMPL